MVYTEDDEEERNEEENRRFGRFPYISLAMVSSHFVSVFR